MTMLGNLLQTLGQRHLLKEMASMFLIDGARLCLASYFRTAQLEFDNHAHL